MGKGNAINIARKLSLKLEIIKIENINFSLMILKILLIFQLTIMKMMTSLLANIVARMDIELF